MPAQDTTQDPGGQQPEFVRGLDAAAKSGGQKPAGQSETATPATEPQAASPSDEQEHAAGILRRNAEADSGSPAKP